MLFKQQQYEYQDGLCCWCLRPMGDDQSWEHVLPKSCGGGGGRRNKVLSHTGCNKGRRSELLVPYFIPYLGINSQSGQIYREILEKALTTMRNERL